MVAKFLARKRFGQHFLTDQKVIQNFVACLGMNIHDHLVEIGPGLGALTRYLLGQCQSLDLIEIDRDLIASLSQLIQEKKSNTQAVRVYQQDVLRLSLPSLLKSNHALRIVGNLPYNISTPILFYLIDHLSIIQDIHVLLQKEVVDRISAKPGSSDYSRLTVMIQSYFTTECLFDVPSTAFSPPPRVQSAYLRLIPLKECVMDSQYRPLFAEIVREAFQQRRKTLHNSLKNCYSRYHVNSHSDPVLQSYAQERPQNLSVADFLAITKNLLA